VLASRCIRALYTDLPTAGTGTPGRSRTFVKPEDFGKDNSQVVVKDTTQCFQINFNHREALVRVTDMDIVPSP